MAKAPGRKPGYRHPEDVRDKIKATQIINRLMKHVVAKTPLMDASQVNAAKTLLNKVLPDLQSVHLGTKIDPPMRDVTPIDEPVPHVVNLGVFRSLKASNGQ